MQVPSLGPGRFPERRSWKPTPGFLPEILCTEEPDWLWSLGSQNSQTGLSTHTILCILKSPAVSIFCNISLRSDYKIMINIFYEWALVFWWIKVLSQKGNKTRANFQKSNLTGTSENQVTLQSRYFWRSLFCD